MVRQRGPAAVRPVVDEFFRRARQIVVGYDGIIDHFLGDAIMAFFNVPIRHEDHITRAVEAAAAIQRMVPQLNADLGEEGLVKLGIGVSTGLVVTGAVGSDRCDEYTALGDAVNIASRLQSAAAPGEVLLEAMVYEVTEDEYPGAEERVLDLKGIDEPVHAYSIRVVPGD